MAGRFSIEATFKALDKVTRPVRKMESGIGRMTRNTVRGFKLANFAIGKFAAGLKRAAVVGAAAFAIFAVAGKNVVAAGAGFEQAITNVGAVALKTRAQIGALEEQARSLGRTTKFTATQAANAMEVLSRAGFSTNDVLQATPAILSAAAASGLEIAEVADHVSNALKGMGLATSEAARVADVLALASSKTNSTIGSLGESIRNVASTARTLNVPLESVAASVALLQDVGLDASVSGSAFNTMLTKMAKPTDSIAKKMKKFGISFKDAKGDMLPLEKVLEQLSIAGKKAGGNFDKVAFFAELVGLRGQKAATNLARLFETGRIKKLTKELKNASGVAKKMADLRMDTVTGSLLLLNSAVESVKISIFELNGGPLKDLIDMTTEWIVANEELIATKITDFIMAIAGAIGFVVEHRSAIGKLIGTIIALTVVLKVLNGVLFIMNLLTLPISATFFLIALAIAAAIAAFAAMFIWIDNIEAGFKKLPFAIRLMLSPLFLLIKAIRFIKDNFGVVAGAFSKVGSFMSVPAAIAGNQSGGAGGAQVVSPQERIARSIEETSTTNRSEITLRADRGTSAEQTGGSLGGGLKLANSGAF